MYFLADIALHLLLPLVLSDHEVIFGNLLHEFSLLNLAHLLFTCLSLEYVLAHLCVHLVASLFLLGLLLLKCHQEVALFLILRFEGFLFGLGTEEGGSAVFMDLHHFLLLLLLFLLLNLKLLVLKRAGLGYSQSLKT